MVRFVALSIATALMLLLAMWGLTGTFGGVALLAMGVAGFGLFVGLCNQLMRQS